MKRFLPVLACVALLVFLSLTVPVRASYLKAPTIEVLVSTGDVSFANYFPAIAGQGCTGMDEAHVLMPNKNNTATCETINARTSFHVIQVSAKKFSVRVHYEIHLPGPAAATVYDGTLPVLARPLDANDKDWIEFGPKMRTAAYFTGSQMHY